MEELRPSRLAEPWGHHALEPGDARSIRLGPLDLRVRLQGEEIWVAHAPGDWTGRRKTSAAPPGEAPSAAGAGEPEEWVRWPVPAATDGVVLSPLYPDRPVVLEPESSFRLLPRAEVRVFVRVPLWVRVAAAAEEARPLADLPSVVLSDTWWGTPVEGELCYWLPTTARRRADREAFAPHLSMCPLHLVNRSDEELPVDELALRVAHLSVYADEGRLWADTTRVRFRGVDHDSEIRVSGRAPAEAPEAVRVADPREPPPPDGFRGRTFARLKSLGMGLG